MTLSAASGSSPPHEPREAEDQGAVHIRAPALRATWFLRLTAGVSVIAAAMGVVVAPGLRGVAADAVVDPVNRIAWALAYFMCGLVAASIIFAMSELARVSRIPVGARGAVIGATGAVLALSVPALARTLPAPVAVALAIAASMVTFVAAWVSLGRPQTRAVGIVLLAFGVAALTRVVSWEVARIAGETSNVRLYVLSRGISTGALVLEGLGQMFAAAWLGTRSRILGQALASAAVAGAFLLTWNAARGAGDLAAPWQSALHIALGGATGLPQPFGLAAVSIFLVVASILLALVAAVQPRSVPAVVFALSLGLLARGSFDVPLRALSATAGALWLMIATIDDRAMWRALLERRGNG